MLYSIPFSMPLPVCIKAPKTAPEGHFLPLQKALVLVFFGYDSNGCITI